MMLRRFYKAVLSHKRSVVILFVLAVLCCGLLTPLVAVNYDMMEYLPEASPSTVALHVLEEEYQLSIPNCRVMVDGDDSPGAGFQKTAGTD